MIIQSTQERPADAVDFRGMIISPAGDVYAIADTGQPRVFQDGIAMEPDTGLTIVGPGPVVNTSMGGLGVNAAGAVVLNSPPDVIHQGVGLTNPGELCAGEVPFAIVSAEIGEEIPTQIRVCYNKPPSVGTCGTADTVFTNESRGEVYPLQAYNSADTNCLLFTTAFAAGLERLVDETSPTDVVTMDYTPGTCAADGDPADTLDQYVNYPVKNSIYGPIYAEIGSLGSDVVTVTFPSDLASTGNTWNVYINDVLAGITDTSIVSGVLQLTLNVTVNSGDTVTYTQTAITLTATPPRSVDGRYCWAFAKEPVTNNAFQMHGYGEDENGQIRGLDIGDGALTFSRSSVASMETWDGAIEEALIDELRVQKGRRVVNLLVKRGTLSEDWRDSDYAKSGTTTAPSPAVIAFGGSGTANQVQWAVNVSQRNNRQFAYQVYVPPSTSWSDPTATLTIKVAVSQLSVPAPATGGIYAVVGDYTGLSGSDAFFQLYVDKATTITDITNAQPEEVTGKANQNPSEYISVGAGDDHGVNADGVAQFAYENGNTLDVNGLLTEAKGPALTTNWSPFYEPATRNYCDGDEDLSSSPETVDLTSSGPGDYTLSVNGTAAVTVAPGSAVGTGFGQATQGSPVTFNLSSSGTVTLTLDSGSLTKVDGLAVKQVEQKAYATSWMPTSGAAETRLADNGSPSFDYSNFNPTEGTLILDIRVEQSNPTQGLFSVTNAADNVLSFNATDKFTTTDGTNRASVDPALGANLGDVIRLAVGYKTGGSLFIGYRNITEAGSWVWDTDGAVFDGAFSTSNLINMLYPIPFIPTQIRDMYYTKIQYSKSFIEGKF